ncbi:NU6M oxidoreductase, partial [Glaucidium brasilianum]|nr:NU6M oxidoreductase [Glaucidium brasilianum]
ITYFVLFLGVGFVGGGLAVASNPSPYYGVSFVSSVLFIVYLGGTLVGFVYSVALAVDPF